MKKLEGAVIVVIVAVVLVVVGIEIVDIQKIKDRKTATLVCRLFQMNLEVLHEIGKMDQPTEIRIRDQTSDEHVKSQYFGDWFQAVDALFLLKYMKNK